MGYFDSPKNRALWDIELNGLKREKEQRKLSGVTGPRMKGASAERGVPGRERISYKELLAEENEARGFKASGRSRSTVFERDKTRQMENGGRSL